MVTAFSKPVPIYSCCSDCLRLWKNSKPSLLSFIPVFRPVDTQSHSREDPNNRFHVLVVASIWKTRRLRYGISKISCRIQPHQNLKISWLQVNRIIQAWRLNLFQIFNSGNKGEAAILKGALCLKVYWIERLAIPCKRRLSIQLNYRILKRSEQYRSPLIHRKH